MGGTRIFRPEASPRSRGFRSFVTVTIPALVSLLATVPALAANDRDFAGFYSYQKTADLSDNKQVTLTLLLLNFSGADVSGATVVVQSTLPFRQAFGNIADVSVNDNGNVSVSGSLTIPEAEYQRWQAGAQPLLIIEYTDDAGNPVQQPVDLIPSVAGAQP